MLNTQTMMLGLAAVLVTNQAVNAQTTATTAATDATVAAGAGSAVVEPAEQTWDAWRKEVTNPAPWWKWGADVRLREKYLHLHTMSEFSPTHERHLQRYRARWWNTFTPADDLEIGVRLMYEGRHYETPDSYVEWYNSPVYIDQLYVKVGKVLDLPMTVTLGRQDIKLGDGWLVLDGTPVDGSRTNYLDAARFNFKFDDINTTVDAIGVVQASRSNAYLPTINSDIENQTEQDETGAILYVTHKLSKETTISPYFIYYHGERYNNMLVPGSGGPAFSSTGRSGGINADLYTFGSHISHKFDDNWKAVVEGAGQFGNRNGAEHLAFGVRSNVVYSFNDAMKTQIRGGYEYLTGNDPDSTKSNQFDPLWGRWPQWSEYMVYGFAAENRVGEATNFHRLNVGVQSDLFENFNASLDYHFLLADENTMRDVPAPAGAGFSDDGTVRGHILAMCLKYKFNEFLSTRLNGELFFPGDYYTAPRDKMGTFLRLEFVFTF